MSYDIERSTEITTPEQFRTIATRIPGQSGITSNPPGSEPVFYRVGVTVP